MAFWGEWLVHVRHGAGSWPSRIAAASAAPAGQASGTGCAFSRHRKHRELWCQLLALTLGTLGFLAAINDRLKFVIALLADIFKNRHEKLL